METNCAYCNRTSEEQAAAGEKYKPSEEHILPESIIGRLKDNPLVLNNVCAYCNNVAGMFFDAPAVRSWLIHMKIAHHAADFANIAEGAILPLKYMGILKGIIDGERICDFWMGPTGDRIYHFHQPYPEIEGLPAMVGAHPSFKKTVDKGYAFIFVRSNNPAWHRTILASFVHAFQGSELYLGNGKRPHNTFSEIPNNLRSVHEALLKYNGVEHSCDNTLSIDAENRFLAKVALGVGCKFLGPSFSQSKMAQTLREYM